MASTGAQRDRYTPEADWRLKLARSGPHCWTPQEICYLRDHYHALGALACAAALDRTPHAVRAKARRLGLRRLVSRWTPEDDEYLQRAYPVIGPRATAAVLGRSAQAVINRASLLGIRCAHRRRWRSQDDQYLSRILARLAEGFGVAPTAIAARVSRLSAQEDRHEHH